MTTTTETKLLTAEDLLRLHSDGMRGELVRGVFQPMAAAGRHHGEIAANLIYELVAFTRPRELGRVYGTDSGVLLERDPDTVREPDVAFVSAERAPAGRQVLGADEAVPDLAVEIRSPTDPASQVREKARMWLDHGVRLLWVVWPESRTVDVYRPGERVATLTKDGALDGHDVLPGFTCPVRAIFPR